MHLTRLDASHATYVIRPIGYVRLRCTNKIVHTNVKLWCKGDTCKKAKNLIMRQITVRGTQGDTLGMHLFAHDYVILLVVPRALSEVLLSALLLPRAASDNELVNSCNYVFVLVRMRLARELIPILQ